MKASELEYMVAEQIASKLECEEGNGYFTIEEYLDGGYYLFVNGWYDIDAKQENDYYNGTGAWNITADVSFDEIEVSKWNEVTEDYDIVDVNEYRIQSETIEFLTA